MNVARKFPLTPHITKALTLIRSFARKARIMLKARRSSVKFVYVLYCQHLAFNLPPSGREVLVFQYLSAFFRTAIFVVLIPKDIPGSFCEF